MQTQISQELRNGEDQIKLKCSVSGKDWERQYLQKKGLKLLTKGILGNILNFHADMTRGMPIPAGTGEESVSST